MSGEAKLLVVPEKYGTYYFMYHNREELLKAFVTIVKRRVNEGWYSYYNDPEWEENLKSRLIDRPVAIPENSPQWMVDAYNTEYKKYKRAKNEYDEFKDMKNLFNQAIAGNGTAAKQMVEEDTNIEYEELSKIEG